MTGPVPTRPSLTPTSAPASAAGALRPLGLPAAVLWFAIPAATLTWSLLVGIRLLTDAGVTPFVIFLAAFLPTLSGLLVAALVGYRREGNPWTWARFSVRMRLGMPRGISAWLWILALTVLWIPFSLPLQYSLAAALAAAAIVAEGQRGPRALIMIAGVSGFAAITASTPQWVSPLASVVFYPSAVVGNFMSQIRPDSFFGIALPGQWWLPVFYVCSMMFINIFGEELLWRGYLLPRQQLVHGGWTWIIHALLWTGFHIFASPNLAQMLGRAPIYLALAFVCQRLENTWPGIVAHAVGNTPILVLIVRGVLR